MTNLNSNNVFVEIGSNLSSLDCVLFVLALSNKAISNCFMIITVYSMARSVLCVYLEKLISLNLN
jgi:hypothetical protein